MTLFVSSRRKLIDRLSFFEDDKADRFVDWQLLTNCLRLVLNEGRSISIKDKRNNFKLL